MKTSAVSDFLPHELSLRGLLDYGPQRLTPREVHELRAALPAMRLRFGEMDVPRFPKLARQLDFLADVVDAFAAERDETLPYHAGIDAAFALIYFHSESDLIPDSQGVDGFIDDATVVTLVLLRHTEALHRFAEAEHLDWSLVDPLTT
jgi:uncharacterized membrane protein YkvA (DUF1232 family)